MTKDDIVKRIVELEETCRFADKTNKGLCMEIKRLKRQLKSLSKKVCDEIRELAGNYFEIPICDSCGNQIILGDCILTGNDFTEILNEIQNKFEKECGDVKD